jgi:hypothetical protein
MDVTIVGLSDEYDAYVIYWRAEYDRRRAVFLQSLEIML